MIWNDNTRSKLCQLVERMKHEFYAAQVANSDARWSLPDSFEIAYSELAGEPEVAGVYLRLFVANPGWVLRNPRDFLVGLFDRWTSAAAVTGGFSRAGDSELLELVNQALCGLLRSQPSLLAQVPQLGYAPAVLAALVYAEANGPALALCLELSRSPVVVTAMAAVPSCVENLSKALKARPDLAATSAECMYNLFNAGKLVAAF